MKTTTNKQKDSVRRTPQRAAILVSIATAFSLLGDQALYAILPTCFEDLGLLGIQVGILLSVNRWIRLITNHVAERIAGRFHATFALILVLTIGAGTTLLYGTAGNFIILLLARMTWGLCWSFLRQFGTMTAVDSATDWEISRSVGLFQGISRIGSIVGFILGGVLYDYVGYEVTFIILAVSTLMAIPAALASGIHRYSGNSQFMNQGNTNPAPRRYNLIFCAAISGLALSAVAASLGHFLMMKVGESVTFGTITIGIVVVNGIILASRYIVGTIGAPVLGYIFDRIGHRTGVAIFTAGAALSLFAVSVTTLLPLLLCLLLVFFTCSTAVHVSLTSQAGKLGARSFARLASASDLGLAAGPGIIWLVLEFINQPVLPIVFGSVLYVVVFFITIAERRTV